LKTKFSHLELGIFASLLPPLGLFSQNKFFFLSPASPSDQNISKGELTYGRGSASGGKINAG
jgi:hypothetical protein